MLIQSRSIKEACKKHILTGTTWQFRITQEKRFGVEIKDLKRQLENHSCIRITLCQ